METIDLRKCVGCPLNKCADTEFFLLARKRRLLVTRVPYVDRATRALIPVPPLQGNPLANKCAVGLVVDAGVDTTANCARCGEVVEIRDQ